MVIKECQEMSDEGVKQFRDIIEFKCAAYLYSTEAEKVIKHYEKDHHIQMNINVINMNKDSV